MYSNGEKKETILTLHNGKKNRSTSDGIASIGCCVFCCNNDLKQFVIMTKIALVSVNKSCNSCTSICSKS